MTVSAVFLSIAVVVKTVFSFYVPLFGQNGMRIDISGIFSMMPAILFGPVYGAIVAALSDILGFLLKPTGAYLPFMTLAVALGGALRGLLWMALRNKNSAKMRVAVAVFSVLILLLGICNIAFLAADGIDKSFYENTPPEDVATEGMHLVSRLLITRTAGAKDPGGTLATYIIFVTAGVVGAAAFGILLLIADFVLSKKLLKGENKMQILPLLIMMVLAGLVVTTLNTVVLRETIESWKLLPFSVLLIPRIIEDLLTSSVQVYFVALLLGIFKKQQGLKTLVK
jgi:ECF transporter S component (folate family)